MTYAKLFTKRAASILLRLPAGVGITCFQLPQHGYVESLLGDFAETESICIQVQASMNWAYAVPLM
jgi:hypothetical protein